jgi:HEAT repeat protein
MGPTARPAIPALIELLDADWEQRCDVREALLAIGNRETLPLLIQALAHASANVRMGAARTIEGMREDAKPAIPRLVVLLNDPDAGVRMDVCIALEFIGNPDVADDLLRTMKLDKDERVRGEAGRAAARLLEDISKVRPIVLAGLEAMKGERIWLKDAEALFSLAGKPAIPEMLTLLENSKTAKEHREVAVQVLWHMGEKKFSGADLQRLVKLIDHSTDDVRRDSLQLLGLKAIGNTNAAKHVEQALKDKAPLVRIQAAECLYRITGQVNAAIGVLVTEMTNADPEVREAACAAVCEFESNGVTAVPGLIARLKDTDSDVRCQAARALGAIGPGAKAAVEAIKKVAAGDADGTVRGVAEQALKYIQPRP